MGILAHCTLHCISTGLNTNTLGRMMSCSRPFEHLEVLSTKRQLFVFIDSQYCV